jgi:colanic acid biosynthesis glycosyl transferase WcaI
MRQRLIARGIAADNIHVADNWADGQQIRPVPHRSSANSLSLLYSGNLGLAHDVDTISEAMQRLKEDSRFRFIFAGGGSLRGGLEDKCRMDGIVSAEFRSYSQRQDLGASLGACDIGLITQRESCLGSVVPSKVYGLLAAGRPIIFIGPAGSTVADIVKRAKCGWHIENGNAASLVDLLKTLVNQPAHVESAGKNARKVFDRYYDLPVGVERICSLVGASRRPCVPIAAPIGLPALSKLLANRGDR